MHAIRLAQNEDLAQIVAIYNSTIASRQVTADLEPISVASRQTWFQAHQRPHRPIYIVENQLDHRIVAWGSFSDYYARPAYDGTVEISIYVHSEMRQMGIGRFLLDYMLQQAPKLMIHNVIAIIFAHNHASLRLFEQFGFALWGRLPEVCDMQEMLADVVILGKKIQSS